MQKVVVVGGGYAGSLIAKALDSIADVTLVEPRSHFCHNVAAIRAFADTSWLDSTLLPYGGLLKKGKVLRDRAVAIADGEVKLAGGATLNPDIVIAATGSAYASPFKPAGDDIDGFLQANRAANENLRAARSVTIVGAGPVGLELAGEIASAYAGKSVTILDSQSTILPSFPARFGQKLSAQLAGLGITLRLGEQAAGTMDHTRPAFDPAKSHLLVPALGAKPVAPPIAGSALGVSGRVKIDGWMRPAGLKRVFVLGDAADAGDPMTVISVLRHVGWLKKALTKSLLRGRSIEALPAYEPGTVPGLLIPLGARGGASVLPVAPRGVVVGRMPTSAIKGRGLFVGRYKREFGVNS